VLHSPEQSMMMQSSALDVPSNVIRRRAKVRNKESEEKANEKQNKPILIPDSF